MDLFNFTDPKIKNLLPYDGTVNYYGHVILKNNADFFFNHLLKTIEWKNDEAIIFGKRIVTKRKVAWYGDHAFSYNYSNVTKHALPWTKSLKNLKEIAERETGETYNSCLLNLYHNGSEGMAWHNDGESALLKNGAIASISFGAERKFSFKHKKTNLKIDMLLEHGSLLVMKDEIQKYWLHRLPPTTKVKSPRINLTFRTIVR